MAAEENKAIVRRFVESVFSWRNSEVVGEV
jgi:hypothetical protein